MVRERKVTVTAEFDDKASAAIRQFRNDANRQLDIEPDTRGLDAVEKKAEEAAKELRDFVAEQSKVTRASQDTTKSVIEEAQALRDNAAAATAAERALKGLLDDIDNAPAEVKELKAELESLTDKYEENARAAKNLGKPGDDAKKQGDGFKSLALKVASSVIAFETLRRAGAAVSDFMREGVTLAIEHERAISTLTFQLENAGAGGVQLARGLDREAEALQRVTGVSSDAIVSIRARAIAMGASVAQSQDFADASLNLAAALGVGLDTATLQLTKTLGGYAGELSEILPEVRELTRAQLQAGAAADIVNAKFAGAAARLGQDAKGQIDALTLSLNDLKKEFGTLAIEIVVGGAEPARGILDDLTDGARQLREGLGEVEGGFQRAYAAALILGAAGPEVAQSTIRSLRAEGEQSDRLRAVGGGSVNQAEVLGLDAQASGTAIDKDLEALSAAYQARVKELSDTAGFFATFVGAFDADEAAELSRRFLISGRSLSDAQDHIAAVLAARAAAEQELIEQAREQQEIFRINLAADQVKSEGVAFDGPVLPGQVPADFFNEAAFKENLLQPIVTEFEAVPGQVVTVIQDGFGVDVLQAAGLSEWGALAVREIIRGAQEAAQEDREIGLEQVGVSPVDLFDPENIQSAADKAGISFDEMVERLQAGGDAVDDFADKAARLDRPVSNSMDLIAGEMGSAFAAIINGTEDFGDKIKRAFASIFAEILGEQIPVVGDFVAPIIGAFVQGLGSSTAADPGFTLEPSTAPDFNLAPVFNVPEPEPFALPLPAPVIPPPPQQDNETAREVRALISELRRGRDRETPAERIPTGRELERVVMRALGRELRTGIERGVI